MNDSKAAAAQDKEADRNAQYQQQMFAAGLNTEQQLSRIPVQYRESFQNYMGEQGDIILSDREKSEQQERRWEQSNQEQKQRIADLERQLQEAGAKQSETERKQTHGIDFDNHKKPENLRLGQAGWIDIVKSIYEQTPDLSYIVYNGESSENARKNAANQLQNLAVEKAMTGITLPNKTKSGEPRPANATDEEWEKYLNHLGEL
jgi:hypothetical protein